MAFCQRQFEFDFFSHGLCPNGKDSLSPIRMTAKPGRNPAAFPVGVSLIAQSVDGFHGGGLPRRIPAKKDADGGGHRESHDDG